jgi:hypothetical protein
MSATSEDVRRWVDEAYLHQKSAGLKYAEACAAVGRALGITPRRVEGIRQREAARITLDEYNSIRAGFRRHLDAEARRLDGRAALLRARRDALR